MPKDAIWLGIPRDLKHDKVLSVFTSRIGGATTLFRESLDYTMFHCPRCKSGCNVSLLSQVYAPLEVYDRILYVLTCSSCSTAGTSFCYAIRSQNFNPSYICDASQTDNKNGNEEGAVFTENDDWGDGCEAPWKEDDIEYAVCQDVVDSKVPSQEALSTSCGYKVFPVVPAMESSISLTGFCYPCYELDIFEEPPKLKTKVEPVKDQLLVAQQRYGKDAVETTLVEDEEESLPEKCLRKFVERISRVPSQCVRWGPGQRPLRSSISPVTVERCQYCGSERRYELQLTSPTIYFLTKGKDEREHTLHFTNILVFTCSSNCNSQAYSVEYCVVEDEI
ncbi:Programmed cell death protein 2 C terminal putative domain [Trypanosoma vivax]|uniref:Programmed cell death protein 2 C-terminal domain-containing protein n=1 Tax=Trypanosoma vivax (strain Y486) TaxID=1055687 RepID=G0TTZ3_TRYVY|nr:hypothetical protein TRVL_09744 [Trypanosoma vivax]KAH8613949.1 Programmed cell death protein 2 C terminal putative domain [Trypanosoma vivax]CCC47426.1 conserved hypothetical protein [Trypanosoma vivax Y486]